MNKYGIYFILTSLFLMGCSESADVEPPSATAPIVESQQQASIEPEVGGPNVVFILADDMGFGDVGFNGSEIATPNLDQMALEGMKLDRNYVYPVCSPTRAALLSGQNPLHMGITGPIDDYASLPEDLKLMPAYFKDLGYQTHMVGKWHLGLSEVDSWPQAKGFDSYYGMLGGWIDFYTHVFARRHDWQRDGVSIYEEGHATDLMTEEAIRIIESSDSETPFLLYLAYNAPHSPLQHPPEYSGLNDYPETSDRSVYAEMMTHMDAGIGRVLDSLQEQGIDENTIVIFSGDNGGALSFGASNGDLRGGKRSAYEGGIRTPGVIIWPGQIDSGEVLEQPIAIHDWLPTLLDAVGVDPDIVVDAYGQSMWDAISQGVQVERDNTIIGAVGNLAVFDWPYKLVYLEGQDGAEAEVDLFNIVEDPYEQSDLSAEMPEIASRLVAQIEAMPEPEVNRLEPAYNNSPRYYPQGEPTWDLRHEADWEAWAEAVTNGTLPQHHDLPE